MEQALSIQDVADLLKMSYSAVYNNRERWGFFRMEGSRIWRIYKSDLDRVMKRADNDLRGEIAGQYKKENLCRSTNEMINGGLISLHQVDAELDALLKQQ